MHDSMLRLSDDRARALSRELREGTGPALERRRGVVGLALVAAGAMGVIALYQMGIIRHLPEPPLPSFNSDEVDAAPEAYRYLSTPDAVLGFGSYAATMGLAAMGGADRAREHPWIPLALAAKVGFDVAQAAKLTADQWTKHRAFCFWCLVASGATVAAAPLVVHEAREALRALRGNGAARATRGSATALAPAGTA